MASSRRATLCAAHRWSCGPSRKAATPLLRSMPISRPARHRRAWRRSRPMDVYQISCDLKPGVRDSQFVEALNGYLGALKSGGKIESWRLLRRKLGLGMAALGEFQILVETR